MTTLTSVSVGVAVAGAGGIAANQTITAGFVASGSHVFGGFNSQPGTTVTDLSADVYRRSAPNTLIVNLDQSFERTWQDQINECGSGSLKILNDDADYSSIQMGDLIRFSVQGYAAFTMIARDWQIDTLVEGEEADELTTISGPGILSVLDEAVVYPSRGVGVTPIETDRVFNWTSPDYDDTDWPTAISISDVISAQALFPGSPTGWPYLPFGHNFFGADVGVSTPIIGPPGASNRTAPIGACFYRGSFTTGDDAFVTICVTADDAADVYIDGQLILQVGGVDQTAVTNPALWLTAGTHNIAAFVTNLPAPGQADPTDYNPTGLAIAGYSANAAGKPVWLLFTTDDTWKVCAYPPAVPGMTPGEVIRHCVTEAQTRGSLTGVTLNFDDDVDSAGNAWPNVTDISTKVGTDYLTFFREISATYFDFWMEPASLTLWAWAKDTRGVASGVTLAATTSPATSNLASLTHHRVI